jgi:hypothetical protein
LRGTQTVNSPGTTTAESPLPVALCRGDVPVEAGTLGDVAEAGVVACPVRAVGPPGCWLQPITATATTASAAGILCVGFMATFLRLRVRLPNRSNLMVGGGTSPESTQPQAEQPCVPSAKIGSK